MFSSFTVCLDQFLPCRQGARQALSVWKLTFFHSGKCLNYSFDYLPPINYLFFLSGTQVIFMNNPVIFLFFISYFSCCVLPFVLGNEHDGQVRNISLLSKSNMTDWDQNI